MARVACVMMQKNEHLLLKPWLAYHGYLFGFENLFVYDNGSTSQVVIDLLHQFAMAGVNVDFTRNEPRDFQHKGRVVGELVNRFKDLDQYDIVLPLDCDEFILNNGDHGPSASRTEILQELDRIYRNGVICRTSHCLDNRPGYVDIFRYVGHVKSVLIVKEFIGIDHGFHQATIRAGTEYATTTLIHAHLHFKPRVYHVESAQNKLRPFLDTSNREALSNYNGVGQHLVKYLLNDDLEYYQGLNGYRFPLIRFCGLSKLLSILVDFHEFKESWEAGRPDGLLHEVIVIDLAERPFNKSAYLEANPGLPQADSLAFLHYVSAGYEEGRSLQASQEGFRDVVKRLEYIRNTKHDGVGGYAGLVLAFTKLNRGSEAEVILTDAINKYGNLQGLLREHALSAMYLGRRIDAMARWDLYRSKFPENKDGYHYGAAACREAGKFEKANEIVELGLERFPKNIGLLIEQAQIAADAGDYLYAKVLFLSLLEDFPNNKEVAERATGALFQIKMANLEDDGIEVDEIDGPVHVIMTAEETAAALKFLELESDADMRRKFLQFESLGHSCEFGLVQRRYGAEPLGLLRWSAISLPYLTKALKQNFAGMDDPQNLKIDVHKREYIVKNRIYATAMHTFSYIDQNDPETIRLQQVKRASYLKRKMLSDLAEGEKIFVYLDDHTQTGEALEEFFDAFRNCSRSVILYVTVAELTSQIGKVEEMGERAIRGYIERLGRDSTGHWNIAFDSWLAVCKSALSLTSSLVPMAMNDG